MTSDIQPVGDSTYSISLLPIQEIIPKQEEDEPQETTDIIEALKASLKVKPTKAKGMLGMAISK